MNFIPYVPIRLWFIYSIRIEFYYVAVHRLLIKMSLVICFCIAFRFYTLYDTLLRAIVSGVSGQFYAFGQISNIIKKFSV